MALCPTPPPIDRWPVAAHVTIDHREGPTRMPLDRACKKPKAYSHQIFITFTLSRQAVIMNMGQYPATTWHRKESPNSFEDCFDFEMLITDAICIAVQP